MRNKILFAAWLLVSIGVSWFGFKRNSNFSDILLIIIFYGLFVFTASLLDDAKEEIQQLKKDREVLLKHQKKEVL